MRLATLFAVLLLLSPLAAAQQTFTVTVEAKTDEHPYNGQGHPSGYVIDGVQGAVLSLQPNTTYTFQMSGVQSFHPFYISTSEVGGGSGVVTEGVTGNFASGDAVLTFTTPDTEGGETFWYQCGNHGFMGFRMDVASINSTEDDADARVLALDSANPSADGARVTLALAEAETVRIEAFDLAGRRVAMLHSGALAGGTEHAFELRGLASGAYVVRAAGADWSDELRVTVSR